MGSLGTFISCLHYSVQVPTLIRRTVAVTPHPKPLQARDFGLVACIDVVQRLVMKIGACADCRPDPNVVTLHFPLGSINCRPWAMKNEAHVLVALVPELAPLVGAGWLGVRVAVAVYY